MMRLQSRKSSDHSWRFLRTALIVILISFSAIFLATAVSLQKQQSGMLDSLEALVAVEAAAVDLKIESYKAALLSLASSGYVADAKIDKEGLREAAKQISQFFGGWFVLVVAGERWNVEMHSGYQDPEIIGNAWVQADHREIKAAQRAAMVSGRPAVTDAYPGPIGEMFVASIVAPVPHIYPPSHFLYMSFDSNRIARMLAVDELPSGYWVSLSDNAQHVIARSANVDDQPPSTHPKWFVAAIRGLASGRFVGPEVDAEGEQDRLWAMQRLKSAPNWVLTVSAPVPTVELSLRGEIQPFFLAFLAILLVTGAAVAHWRYQIVTEEKLAAEITAVEKSTLVHELEASDKRKAALIGIVGHELRTPLIAQLSVLDLIQGQRDQPVDYELIEKARKDGHAMLTLLDDLLEIARLGTGEIRLRQAAFDPVALLEDCAAILEPVAARRNNSIVLKSGTARSPLMGDAGAIRRIVLNFGTNAAKFTRNGRIDLHLSVTEASNAERVIEICVSDTGVGIAEADLPKLFNEFGVLESNRDIAPGGTGLGLAICKRLAEAMGGEVGVDSVLGEGSTFRFRAKLPAAEYSDLEMSRIALQEFKGKSILLAEDQEIIRLATCWQLQTAGACVQTARDGIEAVKIARREPFDLILMDLRMPDMDGAEAARQIRAANGPNVETPIVGLTAHQIPQIAEVLSAGALTACLFKPLDSDLLHPFLSSERPVSPERPKPRIALINHVNLEELRELGSEFAERMLATLLSDIDEKMCEIGASISARDFAATAKESHELSGLAYICGVSSLGRMLNELEQRALAEDAAGVERTQEDLLVLIAQVKRAINDAVASLQAYS